MRAVLCKQFGPIDSLVIEELPSPRPKPGEMVVTMKAGGVSFADTLKLQNKYQTTPTLPYIPGSDMAGIVKEVGEGVTQFKPGDAVLSRASGVCAEEVVVPAAKSWALPPGVDFNVAGGFIGNYATSYYALRDRARLQPGETLLVLGASGGVGLAAVNLGRMMGAQVIACASSADKLEACRQSGAHHLVNYNSEDIHEAVQRITGGKGLDVAYDPVGDRYAEPTARSMGWNGRYLIVGFAAGAIPKISFMLPFEQRFALMGVWIGGFTQRFPKESHALVTELVALLAEGRIQPLISAAYPLERTVDALQALAARQVKGKVVITAD
jgi:NADPH2:quinone reductase